MGTTKIKTSELKEKTLTWAVATAEDLNPRIVTLGTGAVDIAYSGNQMMPFDHWSQGGPIIEQNQLAIDYDCAEGGRWWAAHMATDTHECGPTPLIAAMRCYVASKLGDEVEIPEELL